MLHIGSLKLESRVVLAPMCGVCDSPYLRLLRRFDSRSLVFGEMLSSVALVQAKKPPDIVPEALHPLGLQLFGHDPDTMGRAAVLLCTAGADVIDLNLGCPVPKVARNCDGSALLKDTRLLARILEAMVKAVDRATGGRIPVTIKMRLGWDDTLRNYVEVARIAEACGVAAVTVHGRTRSQLYSGKADWAAIAEVASALSVPVLGNGDIRDPVGAAAHLADSGCAGLMVGRGAMGNPWLLPRIDAYLQTGELLPEPSVRQRFEVAREHCRMLVAAKGPRTGVAESRKHVAWYTRGLPGSAELRARVNRAGSPEELDGLLAASMQCLPPL